MSRLCLSLTLEALNGAGHALDNDPECTDGELYALDAATDAVHDAYHAVLTRLLLAGRDPLPMATALCTE